MANEGTPPALPQVIESLPKKNITKEQVGKCHHKGALQKVSDIFCPEFIPFIRAPTKSCPVVWGK